MPGEKTTARLGRPHELNKVVRYRADGTPVTAGEQVISRRRLGLEEAEAAASAGVSKTTLHHWRIDGARMRAIEAQGKRELDEHEASLRDFVNALETAEADWEASRLAIIDREATGGYTVTKIVEKVDADGKVIERTTTTETAKAQWQAAAWQLERMRRDKYARRYEVTGKEGEPLIPEQDAARNLADSLRAFHAEQKPKATPRAHRPRKTKESTA